MEVVVIHCSGSDDMAETTRFSWPSEQWSIIRHLFVVITSCYASSQPNVSGSVVSTVSFLLSICSIMIVSAFIQTLAPQPSWELCCFALPSGLFFFFVCLLRSHRLLAACCSAYCVIWRCCSAYCVIWRCSVRTMLWQLKLRMYCRGSPVSCHSVFSAVRHTSCSLTFCPAKLWNIILK